MSNTAPTHPSKATCGAATVVGVPLYTGAQNTTACPRAPSMDLRLWIWALPGTVPVDWSPTSVPSSGATSLETVTDPVSRAESSAGPACVLHQSSPGGMAASPALRTALSRASRRVMQ